MFPAIEKAFSGNLTLDMAIIRLVDVADPAHWSKFGPDDPAHPLRMLLDAQWIEVVVEAIGSQLNHSRAIDLRFIFYLYFRQILNL